MRSCVIARGCCGLCHQEPATAVELEEPQAVPSAPVQDILGCLHWLLESSFSSTVAEDEVFVSTSPAAAAPIDEASLLGRGRKKQLKLCQCFFLWIGRYCTFTSLAILAPKCSRPVRPCFWAVCVARWWLRWNPWHSGSCRFGFSRLVRACPETWHLCAEDRCWAVCFPRIRRASPDGWDKVLGRAGPCGAETNVELRCPWKGSRLATRVLRSETGQGQRLAELRSVCGRALRMVGPHRLTTLAASWWLLREISKAEMVEVVEWAAVVAVGCPL
eukprot:6471550-Amphidinium_carterae.1